ncbi:hypothetical protein, partial [Nocardioides sp.]|uniref:hypothetical protein n=1 Tax=Nocardioides sp. TaxID=35761 RepID=UPI0035647697
RLTPPPVPAVAAHKPGAIPLRPLGLADMYDAAFRIIRFNPKATVGSAVLVAAVAMAIPVLVTAVLTWTVGLSLDADAAGTAEMVSLGVSYGSLGLGTLLQSVGLVLVGGMIAHVTAAAALGRRLTLGQAWAATYGKRWKLIGLAAVLGSALFLVLGLYAASWVLVVLTGDLVTMVVFGLVSVPAFLAFLFWFWIRVYYLPAPALMLEPVGVFGAIGRGFGLTRRQFWRTFGIALLTVVIAQIAGGMLSMPVSIVGQGILLGVDSEQYAALALVVTQALATVIASAFVAPFTTTVAAVQYLDQRIRKEAYDVELMTRAGVLHP